jgi:hypothetical protein
MGGGGSDNEAGEGYWAVSYHCVSGQLVTLLSHTMISNEILVAVCPLLSQSTICPLHTFLCILHTECHVQIAYHIFAGCYLLKFF